MPIRCSSRRRGTSGGCGRGRPRPARRAGGGRRRGVAAAGAARPRRAARRFQEADRGPARGRLRRAGAARAAGRVEIGVGAASVAEIERINILQAACWPCAGRWRGCRRRPTSPWSTATSRLPWPARCAAWSAATRCACRSPPPRSWPRWCATGDGPAGGALPGLWLAHQRRLRHGGAPAALLRLGRRRHHRPTFGPVRQLSLALVAGRFGRLTRPRRARSESTRPVDASCAVIPSAAFRTHGDPPARGDRPRTAAGPDDAGRRRAHDAHAAGGLGPLRLRRPALQPAVARRTAPPRRQPGRRRRRGLGPVHRFRRL